MSEILSLTDSFKRKHEYLRLSITDVCNFRCTYCLPNGYEKPDEADSQKFLNSREIHNLLSAFVRFGTAKVRITGGEPTLRKDFLDIVHTIRQFPEIKQIALSTNGYRMAKDVAKWREAGISSINVSLDSIDPRMFHSITGMDKFNAVMAGIDEALKVGYKKIKVNAVLLKNLNHQDFQRYVEWVKDKSIQLRFIELMQTGSMDDFFSKYHVSGQMLADSLADQGWNLRERSPLAGPAKVYTHPNYMGEIGFILPYSKNFCADCNRLRVSARGELHLCLFGDRGYNLRDLLQDPSQQTALEQRIFNSVQLKRAGHFLNEGDPGVRQHLASIGG